MNKLKNVILILTDQMRGDCLGVCGNEEIFTPHLDDFAKESVVYTNAQSSNPSCIAARAQILTGQPASKNGFFGYQDRVKWEFQNTLVDQLNSRGYKTINIGKTHFYPQRNKMNFTVNELYDPQQLDAGFESDYHHWLRTVVNSNLKDPAREFENNSWITYDWPGPAYSHPTEWTSMRALENLQVVKGQPFFMQISFHRPHPPLDAPEFYRNLYPNPEDTRVVGDWAEDHSKSQVKSNGVYGEIPEKYYKLAKAGYYASITHIDYQVGKIIEYLKQNNLYEDTMIIFTSDHGEMLGDHHMFRKATPFRGSVHFPLVIHANNKIGTDNRIATHIDLLPTILNYVDDNYNQKTDGIDLMSDENREILFGEHPFDRGWHYTIDDKYKYIWDSVSGKQWCFDIENDIDESLNIIEQISEKQLEYLEQNLINYFKLNDLLQFVENNKLKPGTIIPAYQIQKKDI